MADIAFLLNIFFLVPTTIPSNEELYRLSPKLYPVGIECNTNVHELNILRVVLNSTGEIMIEDEIITIELWEEITKSFLDNNGDGSCSYCTGTKNHKSSDNPKKAIVSLQNSHKTTYQTFIAVQNELTKAYFELRKSYRLNVVVETSRYAQQNRTTTSKSAYLSILSEAETK